MPEVQPPILLLSSNRRRRYSEDILTALASPPGSVIRFRYRENIVSPTLQQIIANNSILGRPGIIGFIGAAREVVTPEGADIPDPVVVPIRMVSVLAAENVGNIYIFRLRVDGYPDLSEMATDLAGLGQEGKKYYDKLVELNGGYYPAVVKCPNMHLSAEGDPAQLWIGIVRRLAQHPTFSRSCFVRVGHPVSASLRQMAFDAEGRLRLGDGQSIKLPVTFYSEQYIDTGQVSLSCLTDDRYLRLSSAGKYDVASRYDSVEFWLQPRTEAYDTKAGVAIKLTHQAPDGAPQPAVPACPVPLTTNTEFPVVVARSRSRLAARVVVSAFGAFLVALPGIVGVGASLPLRVVSAVAGAILLACAAIVIPRS
jgi:hypothetical protein